MKRVFPSSFGVGLVASLLLAGLGRSDELAILEEQNLEHKDGVQKIAYTRDGKLLASASSKFIRLWDVSGPKAKEIASLADLKFGGGGVRSLTFFPDGKTLAAGVGGNTLRLYDVRPGKLTERLTLKDQNGNVQSLAVSPDGKTLAAGSDDMTVLLYDITGDKPRERVRFKVDKANFGVKALCFLPDGNSLVLGTGNGAVRRWDISGDKPRETYAAPKNIQGDSFQLICDLSPDGSTLAVADEKNKTIHLWGVAADKFEPKTSLKAHEKAIGGLVWSPDGKLLASADKDGRVIVWDAAAEKPLLDRQRSGHFESAAFSPAPPGGGLELTVGHWSSPGAVYVYRIGKPKP